MILSLQNIRKLTTIPVFSLIILYLVSFFFIFWISTYFEVDVFPLEDRSTIYSTFHFYIFDEYTDAIIITLLTTLWFFLTTIKKFRIFSVISYGGIVAISLLTNYRPLMDFTVLVSIPLITTFFIYNQFSNRKIIKVQNNLFMSFFSLSIFCIAVSGIIITVFSLNSNFQLEGEIQNYAVKIFWLFSSFSPALILVLVIGSTIKLFVINGLTKIKNNIQHIEIISFKINKKNKFIFLILFMFLSIFLALLPHQFFINNENEIVGEDTVSYVNWLNNTWINGQEEVLYQAFVIQHSGEIPLALLLFSPVLTIFPDNPYLAIDYLPIILLPLLVLTVFFFTRELCSNDTIALFASFLTAISFHTLMGIYGGLYSNLLALILGYSSFVFLLRFLKKPTSIDYLAFSGFFFLMMLSHVYTWTFFVFFIAVFLIFSYYRKFFEKKRLALIFLIIVATLVFDVGKSIMTDIPNGIERDVIIASTNLSNETLSSFWVNLSQASLVYMGGLLGNFLILSLCVYWLVRSNLNQMSNLFLAIFLSIAIIPILFGDEVIQSRVLFNIPFQIPAAIGLVYLANLHRGKVLVIAISIWILTMTIQALINFT